MSGTTITKTIIDNMKTISDAGKDWLTVEKSIQEAAENLQAVTNLTNAIDQLTNFAGALSVAGAGLSLVNLFLPSPTSIIMKELSLISKKITVLQNDIDSQFKQLDYKIEITAAHTELFKHITTINTSESLWNDLVTATSAARTKCNGDPTKLGEISTETLLSAYNKYVAVQVTATDITAFSTNLKAFDGSENILKTTYTKSNGEIQAIQRIVNNLLSQMIKGKKMLKIQGFLADKNVPLDKTVTINEFKSDVLPNLIFTLAPSISDKDFIDKINAGSTGDTIDTAIKTVATQGKQYINKCMAMWSKYNVKNYLDHNIKQPGTTDSKSTSIVLPSDPFDIAKTVLARLAKKYPFVDWVVVVGTAENDSDTLVASPSLPDQVAKSPAAGKEYNKITFQEDSLSLKVNYFSPQIFQTAYPDYFDDDSNNIHMFIWGFRKDNPKPLVQLTSSLLPYTYFHGYLDPEQPGNDPRDGDISASDQFGNMVSNYVAHDYQSLKKTYKNVPAPFEAYVVMHQPGLEYDMGFMNYACTNNKLLLATYNYNAGGDYGWISNAAHHQTYWHGEWTDPMAIVLRIHEN